VDRSQILAEIRRTAEANGGTALGRNRFAAETGIRESDWSGRYWTRWNDALAEAGYPPNRLQERHDDEKLLAALIDEIRRHGRTPTMAELKLRRHQDDTFPNPKTFSRFGPKSTWAARVADHCTATPGYDLITPEIAAAAADEAQGDEADSDAAVREGFVYLLKSGRHYKIGHTLDVGRRRYDLAIQLPEPVSEEHVIATDDPVGIERYWHRRFADRRLDGEWFALTRADVKAFKRRRKFM